MKKILALLLSSAIVITTFAGCGEETGTVESTESVKESVEKTQESPKEEEPVMLVDDIYSNAGLQLVYDNYDKYFKKKKIALKTSLIDDGDAVIWGYASYLESLCEAVKKYPEKEDIKEYYIQALEGLKAYLVEDATIHAPSGDYEGQIYYNAGREGKGDYYYDDNAWICIQLFEAYNILGDEYYKETALKLLDFFWTGYDDYQKGGIYWDKTYGNSKGSCTNSPITICYLMGYNLTGNEDYLDKAMNLYTWLTETSGLLDNSNALHEGINPDGSIRPWTAAYDQGTLLYSTSMLYEITGDEKYKEFGKELEQSCIRVMYKTEGGKTVLKGNPIFKAWCMGWLVRGVVKYYDATKTFIHPFMDEFLNILDVELTTKNKIGQYDPYFSTGEWWDGEYYDNDILQPTGISTVFTISGYFHENMYIE